MRKRSNHQSPTPNTFIQKEYHQKSSQIETTKTIQLFSSTTQHNKQKTHTKRETKQHKTTQNNIPQNYNHNKTSNIPDKLQHVKESKVISQTQKSFEK